jgi:hypothetical protein
MELLSSSTYVIPGFVVPLSGTLTTGVSSGLREEPGGQMLQPSLIVELHATLSERTRMLIIVLLSVTVLI